MPTLLIISPATVTETPAGEVILDVGFVEGMKLHCQLWPGQVHCLMRRGSGAIPRGMRFSRRQLDFSLIVQDQADGMPDALLDEASLIYCAADDMRYLDMPDRLRGRLAKLVYTIERPLSGRLRQAAFDNRRGALSKLRGMQWALGRERALRRALAGADGLHCNGPLAADAYARVNQNVLGYFDNRMRLPMLARGPDQAARAERLRAGAPLSLAWYGPLEPEAGAQDLLVVAQLLNAAGMEFRLQLFGTGSLEQRLRDGIASMGLQHRMTVTDPPGFDTALVPQLRRNADLFLAPLRLADPVSSYVEAMGCGLPVLGYGNPLWRRVLAQSGGGWQVPARAGALARRILHLDTGREAIIETSARALEYARENTFETVFSRRMAHLRRITRLD